MAKFCDICGKGPGSGHNVSKSGVKVKRRWLPNLHKIKARLGDSVKTIKICSKCLKAQKVVKVV